MADAETTRYALVKPEVGASSDTWGSKWNNNADDQDALLSAITTTGSANAYVLTTGLSLAAYVSGQSFLIKANFTNSGAATINVDGLGAKSLVKGVSTALASGDMVSGAFYRIAYDGTNFIVQNSGGVSQPLDATLTALAALSWSSGNALVQMTAADTVSLTLTPSISRISCTDSTGATTHAGRFINATDAAAVLSIRIEGDRATPANNDAVYAGFFLSDSAGNQDEMARIRCLATDVTNTSEDARLDFFVAVAGTLTAKLTLNGTNLVPNTDDGLALGASGQGFADAFFAAGAVLNFNAGGVTLTHDATNDRLVLAAGSLKARPSISTDTGGTLTSASDNCIVDLATAPTINDGIHEAGSIIVLVNNTASSMTITQDTGMTLRLHGTATTGNRTLAARGIATVQIDPASNAEAIVMGDVT